MVRPNLYNLKNKIIFPLKASKVSLQISKLNNNHNKYKIISLNNIRNCHNNTNPHI